MHHAGCKLLLIFIIGALYYPDSASGEEKDVVVTTDVTSNQDSSSTGSTDSSTLKGSSVTESVQISPQNATTGNGKLDLNVTSKDDDDQLAVKKVQKKGIDDQMLNDFRRFLLFPFLPFLLPPGDDKTNADFLKPNEKDSNLEDEKPFIVFDFAFNIREIPLANDSALAGNDSKIINVKKISDAKPPPAKEAKEGEVNDIQKLRKRRNTSKRENVGFFDDFPFFSGPQVDEIFSKPNFFVPGLSEPKTANKLSRRKRDMKKIVPDVRSDLQFFMDALDRAFMDTKNDFEQTDPLLNFIKGMPGPFFDDDKKIDFMNGFPDQESPNVNWKVQRNVKRLNGEVQNEKGLPSQSREVPIVIVDKVVKIGEFHVGDEKDKLTKNKRTGSELNRKFMDGLNHDEVRIPMFFNKDEEDAGNSHGILNFVTEVKTSESDKRKRNLDPESKRQVYNVKSQEVRILPQINTSAGNVGTNATSELKKKDESISEQDKSLKMIDSMKRRMDMTNSRTPSIDRFRRRSYDRQTSKIPLHDDLKRNITQVLNRFFELFKKLDDAKLMDKLESGERDMEAPFDWTEKETLQNANVFRKARKPKNELQFQEYLDAEKKERQVADLNYLFLTVTLPTILVFGLVLLVCIFNLQVKGKIWTRLFRPRQILLVEGKPAAQLNGSSVKMKSAPQSI